MGRLVTLHDNHDPAVIVGEVDPDSMVETRDGLKVSGKVDLDTERGSEIWRSLRANRIGFSFGYLATKERERDDGGREVLELDAYEISTTPSPMNNRTRILSTKSDDIPAEMVGTSLDPAITGEIPTKAEIDVAMKALRAARPIRIASLKC